MARLALALYSYLGLGTRWTGKLIRLMIYAGLLLPGFIQARPLARTTVTCPLLLHPRAAANDRSKCGSRANLFLTCHPSRRNLS